MKRALLIAGGTVGGLGAVLSITPPQLNSQGAMGGLSAISSAAATSTTPIAQTTTTPPTATTSSNAITPTSTTAATAKASTVKKKKVTTKKVAVAKATKQTVAAANTSAATTPAANTPAATTPATATPTAATKKVSGTFAGNVVNVNYGNVQVQITVVDGKITDAQALQAPSGRSDRYTQYALPILRSQTLAAQGSNIQGASGASYTSYGWYTSLQAALAKAGL